MHLFPKYPRRETTLRRRREGEFYRPRIMGRESLLARSLVVSQEGRIQERRRIVVYEPVILDHPSFPRLPPPPPKSVRLASSSSPSSHPARIRIRTHVEIGCSTPGKNTLAPSRKLLFRASLKMSELFLVGERTYRVCRRDDKRQIPTAGDELPKRRGGVRREGREQHRRCHEGSRHLGYLRDG